MALILFRIKIAVKRIIASVKSSPFTVVWVAVIIGAFIYGFVYKHINVEFNAQAVFFITCVLMIFSLLKSLRNYNLTPLLIIYSKSKYNNKIILKRNFFKQAILNNVLLIIFNIIAYSSMMNIKYFIIIPGLTIFSIFASFVIMYFKYNIISKSIIKANAINRKSNPSVKSIIYDYLSPDFIALLVLCAALVIIFSLEFINDINNYYELYSNSGFLILMTVVFSLGFMGILESIPGINWNFHTIVSLNDYKYHLKRTIIFLCSVYGWLFILFTFFIIAGSIINRIFILKYLYCLFIIFFAVINIAFTAGNMLIKTIKSLLIIAITMWFSALPVIYLPILIIAVFILFIKAKNEYREWFLS